MMAVLKSIVKATRSPKAARGLEALHFSLAAVWLTGCIASVAYVSALNLPAYWFIGAVLIGVVTAALGVTLFSLWGELYGQHARDLKAKTIFEAVQAGRKPPAYVLYLRPFASTGAFSERGIGPVFGGAGLSLAALSGEEVELEAQIERAVRPLGTLVALGEPLEHIGAGRILATDDTWRDAVRTLLPQAELIVLLPSSREGTLEEVRLILDSDLIQRTVVVDPPNISRSKVYDHSKEWEAVRAVFLERGFDIPKDSRNGALFYYGDERKPRWKERLDIDSEDRIERLFKRVVKVRARAAAA